ncbi:MAG: hypothetical protein ACRC2T_09535, partial [Thermoguttaceae bacterium]
QGEFGWSLPHRTVAEIENLKPLISEAGINWLKIPMWQSTNTTQKEWERLSNLCEWMSHSANITPVGLFTDPPPEVLDKILGTDPTQRQTSVPKVAEIFSSAQETWYPSIEPTLLRLALVRHWQLGDDEDTSITELDPLMPQIDAVRAALETVAAGSSIGFAWDWTRNVPLTFSAARQTELDNMRQNSQNQPGNGQPLDTQGVPQTPPFKFVRDGKEFLSLSTPDPLTYLELEYYLPASESSNCDAFVVLRPISKQEYSLENRIMDMVQRMLTAKILGAKATFVPEPFDNDTGLMNANGTPGELLLPWRTTSLMVSGKNYVGEITLPQKSNNMIFEGDTDGVMVVWNNGATLDNPVNEILYLGNDCEIVDLWGKRTKLLREGKSQIVPAGPLPQFITGVNKDVTRFRQAFELEKKSIPSEFGPKIPNSFTFKNIIGGGLGGELKLVAPPSWQLDPVTVPINLAEGETLTQPFDITLTPRATSGSQPFRVDFQLEGVSPGAEEFSVYDQIDVGDGDIYLEPPVTRLNPKTNELEVYQALINDTDQAVSFRCTLNIPGAQQQKYTITNQGFGRIDHTYVIKNGQRFVGKQLSITAREFGSGNRTLRCEFQATK